MVKKTMTDYQYYIYLCNQQLSYWALEGYADYLGLFDDIDDLKRSTRITKDLQELEHIHGFRIPAHLNATKAYIDYIDSISDNPKKLMAHIYVRHMGDLSGGQIIKRFVPGSGLYYQFDTDVETLKEKVRNKLSNDMADEANTCFNMVFDILTELESSFATMGKTDRSI
jgi:heme oxygenase